MRIKGKDFDRSGFLKNLRLKDQELEFGNVTYSPDGKKLASSRQNEIIIWDAEAVNRFQECKVMQVISPHYVLGQMEVG